MSDPLAELRRGFTLLESMLASVVLAISVFAVTLPFTASVRNDEAQQRRTVAAALAQEMMEEILAKPFSDPQGESACGPEAGESSRALFDNIDDYHSLNEQADTIAGFSGLAMTEAAAAGLSRHVTVEYVYVSGQETDQTPTFVRLTVEVRYGDTPLVKLTRLVYSRE